MAREVERDRVDTVLEELTYPIMRPDAALECADVTLVLSEGTANLGELISETSADSFDDPDEIAAELDAVLARDAVSTSESEDG